MDSLQCHNKGYDRDIPHKYRHRCTLELVCFICEIAPPDGISDLGVTFRESQGDFFGSVNIEYFRRKIFTDIFSVFIRSFYNELFFFGSRGEIQTSLSENTN